jgi:hypothetical protein
MSASANLLELAIELLQLVSQFLLTSGSRLLLLLLSLLSLLLGFGLSFGLLLSPLVLLLLLLPFPFLQSRCFGFALPPCSFSKLGSFAYQTLLGLLLLVGQLGKSFGFEALALLFARHSRLFLAFQLVAQPAFSFESLVLALLALLYQRTLLLLQQLTSLGTAAFGLESFLFGLLDFQAHRLLLESLGLELLLMRLAFTSELLLCLAIDLPIAACCCLLLLLINLIVVCDIDNVRKYDCAAGWISGGIKVVIGIEWECKIR